MQSTPTFGPREWQVAYAAAMRVLKDPNGAEDAAQNALLRAFCRAETFDQRGSLHAWLRTIAKNCALTSLRRARARREVSPADAIAPANDAVDGVPGTDPEALAASGQLAAALAAALAELSELDRLAFTERYLRGTSERELGAILEVSTNAAKQRAFRARRSVRAHVRAAGWAPPPRKAA